MLMMSEKEKLNEFKLLHNKSPLTDNEKERFKTLCDSLNEDYFCESMLELLDTDQELNWQILNYLDITGDCIEQIVFGGVAIGCYLLERLYPSATKKKERFQAFWIDPCDYSEEMTRIVDAAINRAIDKMIADTN